MIYNNNSKNPEIRAFRELQTQSAHVQLNPKVREIHFPGLDTGNNRQGQTAELQEIQIPIHAQDTGPDAAEILRRPSAHYGLDKLPHLKVCGCRTPGDRAGGYPRDALASQRRRTVVL